MFSYYGSKSKIVKYYPKPRYNKIIEPFAGSARYSLLYFENDIVLYEKSNFIYDIWMFLKNASKQDILNIPILKIGTDIRTLSITGYELNFMRFFIGQGLPAPQWIVSSMCTEINQKRTRNRIAKDLYKIKHWQINLGSYEQVENEMATWFVDPPYQFGGHKYLESNKHIDFTQLAKWCKSRNGQTIVCENTKSNWLPFKPMTEMHGTMFKTTEAIWSNLETAYDYEQMSLAI